MGGTETRRRVPGMMQDPLTVNIRLLLLVVMMLISSVPLGNVLPWWRLLFRRFANGWSARAKGIPSGFRTSGPDVKKLDDHIQWDMKGSDEGIQTVQRTPVVMLDVIFHRRLL